MGTTVLNNYILPVDAITSLASDANSIGSISENELFVITIPPSV